MGSQNTSHCWWCLMCLLPNGFTSFPLHSRVDSSSSFHCFQLAEFGLPWHGQSKVLLRPVTLSPSLTSGRIYVPSANVMLASMITWRYMWHLFSVSSSFWFRCMVVKYSMMKMSSSLGWGGTQWVGMSSCRLAKFTNSQSDVSHHVSTQLNYSRSKFRYRVDVPMMSWTYPKSILMSIPVLSPNRKCPYK